MSKKGKQVTPEEFVKLCSENKVQEIKDILKLLPRNEVELLIHANDDKAFCNAAWYDRIEVIRLLLEFTPDPKQRNKMIHANDDEAFSKAASMAHRGQHSEIVKLLVELTPDFALRERMIHNYNDAAFKYCVGDPSIRRDYGHYNLPIGFAWNEEHAKSILSNRELIDLFLGIDIDYYENLAKSLDMALSTAEYITKIAQEIRVTRTHNINVLTKFIHEYVDSNPKLSRLSDIICNLIAQYEGGVESSLLGQEKENSEASSSL